MPSAKKLVGIYLLWSLAVLVLWWTPLSYPLQLLATLIHELGHITALSLTGGEA